MPDTPELVTVSHPTEGTDQVPIDAALALEAQKTGWVRDHKAQIAQLEAEKATLEARIDELEAEAKAAKADEASDTPKGGRKPAAKADEASDTKPKEG